MKPKRYLSRNMLQARYLLNIWLALFVSVIVFASVALAMSFITDNQVAIFVVALLCSTPLALSPQFSSGRLEQRNLSRANRARHNKVKMGKIELMAKATWQHSRELSGELHFGFGFLIVFLVLVAAAKLLVASYPGIQEVVAVIALISASISVVVVVVAVIALVIMVVRLNNSKHTSDDFFNRSMEWADQQERESKDREWRERENDEDAKDE